MSAEPGPGRATRCRSRSKSSGIIVPPMCPANTTWVSVSHERDRYTQTVLAILDRGGDRDAADGTPIRRL
ncbi:MAG: hypothetical protein QOF30_1776 [Acidimicrobiaceae bacterium]|jgi:hypothetical protein|nr:hypothetical protein [Acidimicrobiaceae bacterium]